MIKKVIAILMSAGIIITSLSGCSIDKTILGNDVTSSSIEYENKIFDNSYVHEINIKISKDNLEDLLENPLDKTNYKVDVTIDGETCKNVSFKTKGNTSLSEVASDEDSDCLDVDEVIKYFVAHNFVDNYDSYTGNMLHQWLIIQ
ncbi:MAG: hypothetical protein PUD42_08860 [Clostridiales bacterium]|nr:hypothetical protein [Clostridiales bacterium]